MLNTNMGSKPRFNSHNSNIRRKYSQRCSQETPHTDFDTVKMMTIECYHFEEQEQEERCVFPHNDFYELEDKKHKFGFCGVGTVMAKSSKSGSPRTNWTPAMDDALRKAVEKYKGRNWKLIAEEVEGRNHVQCLQRWKKCIHPSLVKGHWNSEEDAKLKQVVEETTQAGERKSWAEISKRIPGRTAKQCRERWSLNLDPSINKGPWSEKEDKKLLELHKSLGNRWSELAKYMEGRTENAVKGRYKSLTRAEQKLWTMEEDSTIIECKCAYKYRWNTISKKLKGRSKNAVRLRWKYMLSIDPTLETVADTSIFPDSKTFADTTAKRLYSITSRTTPPKVQTDDPDAILREYASKETIQSSSASDRNASLQQSLMNTILAEQLPHFVPKRVRHSSYPPSGIDINSSSASSSSKRSYERTRNLRAQDYQFRSMLDTGNTSEDQKPKGYKRAHGWTPSFPTERKRKNTFGNQRDAFTEEVASSESVRRSYQREIIDDALKALSGYYHGTDNVSEVTATSSVSPVSDLLPNSQLYRNIPSPVPLVKSPRIRIPETQLEHESSSLRSHLVKRRSIATSRRNEVNSIEDLSLNVFNSPAE